MLCRLGPVTSLPFGLGSLQLKRLLGNWNLRMERKKEGGDGAAQSAEAEAEAEGKGMKFKPQVYEMRQLLLSSNTHSSSSSSSPPSVAWESCWEQGLTPWDLGQPTPILLHLYRTGTLPKGRALIPGCGAGYDVVAIACPERFVVGLDISDVAIKKATALSSSSSNVDYFTFLTADFFNWNPPELFDLVFDYTFFCAIEPEMRPRWASQIRHLLKPNAELITLIFPISDHTGGPPYKVSVSDYEEVLHPMGFKPVSVVDNELAFGPRKGREKLARWKMPLRQSLDSLL